MTPDLFLDVGLSPALRLLPNEMDSLPARALVLAICLQESGLTHRRQVKGPAKGYAQFEVAGCTGVLTHRDSRIDAVRICRELDVTPTATAVHRALEFQDVLTCVFARLLLWTLPEALPGRGQPWEAWLQYRGTWRPGKPHHATWNEHYAAAWAVVEAAWAVVEEET